MRASHIFRVGLRALLPVALASMHGCSQSECVVNPELDACRQLENQIDPFEVSKIPREARTVSFEVHNLQPGADVLPTAKLKTTDGESALTTVSSVQGQDSEGGVVEVRTEDPASLKGGPVSVTVATGKRSLTIDTFVYTPPRYDVTDSPALTRSYATPSSPLELSIVPVSAGSPAYGLFVSEQDDNQSQRSLYKYLYDKAANKLVVDTTFGPLVVSDLPGQLKTRFAVSAKTAFVYQYSPFVPVGYYLTPYQLSPFMNGGATRMQDRDTTRPDAQILAVDPVKDMRAILDSGEIDVFKFDYGVSYQAITSLKTATPVGFLTVRHWDLDAKSAGSPTDIYTFDAVGVDKNNQIQIYRLSNNLLSIDDVLTQAANEAARRSKANEGLGESTIVGLAVVDLDRDDLPDIVLALQTAGTTETRELGWLRYQGRGKFGTLNSSTRAKLSGPALQKVRSLAIGDLDGDGKPDAALATDSAVQLYLNKSL